MTVAFVLIPLTFAAAAPALAADRDKGLEMAQCLYQKHQGNAERLLNARTEVEADNVFRALVNESGCYRQVFGGTPGDESEEARLTMGTMRGLFAEQALKDRSAAVRALTPLPQQTRYVRPWFPGTARVQWVDEMAVCVADTNPAAVASLLATAPQSAVEESALKAMEPAVDRCMSKGTSINGSNRQVRAALADALYQRVNAPRLSMNTEMPK
jgi:hypothetical protein